MHRLALLVLLIGCSHDLDAVQGGGMDADVDSAVADTAAGDTGTPPADTGGSRCNAMTCTTTLPCAEAICEGDVCMVRPRCALGEECCGDACVPAGCSDGVDCTDDSCGGGGCESTPNNALCTAASGGACDPATGCQYPVCDATTCAAGPCETARCESGTCVRESMCSGTQECCAGACVPLGCDDGNPCTNDSCGGGGCENSNNSAACDDGDVCNGPDCCRGGSCSDHGPDAPDDTRCGGLRERCCGGSCVNTERDAAHCGFCDNACPSGVCAPRTSGGTRAGTCNCGSGGTCPSSFECESIMGGAVQVCSCVSSACGGGTRCVGTGGGGAVAVCAY